MSFSTYSRSQLRKILQIDATNLNSEGSSRFKESHPSRKLRSELVTLPHNDIELCKTKSYEMSSWDSKQTAGDVTGMKGGDPQRGVSVDPGIAIAYRRSSQSIEIELAGSDRVVGPGTQYAGE